MTVSAPLLSLVLPTYNERENLPAVVDRLVRSLEDGAVDFEIVVVDDDSPDGTWALAEEMSARDPRIRCVRRIGERGLATAVVAGWRHARGRILGVMDADLQYRPESLPVMLAIMRERGADIAIGSRYAPGATVQEWSVKRWAISLSARLIARLALPDAVGSILDPGAGYFLVERRVLDGVDLRPRGFKILIEVLARGRFDRVIEVGQQYEGRKEGQSKLRGRQVVEYVTHLMELSRATGELARSFRWTAAGLAGVAASLGLLAALVEVAGLPYLAAGAIGAEAAILATFVLHEALTARRPADAERGLLRRLGAWHGRRLAGGLLGLGVLGALTSGAGVPYLQSALVAAGVNAIANYVAGARLRPRPARETYAVPSVAPSRIPTH